MMKPKYIFLTLSLVELTIGLSNARQNVFFYLGLPIGAILFGLFLIAQVMEKESALYDEQNRAAKLEPEPDVSKAATCGDSTGGWHMIQLSPWLIPTEAGWIIGNDQGALGARLVCFHELRAANIYHDNYNIITRRYCCDLISWLQHHAIQPRNAEPAATR